MADDEIIIRISRTKARAFGRKRWKGVSKDKRREFASTGGKTAWADLSPEERSTIMKARAAKRKKRRPKERQP